MDAVPDESRIVKPVGFGGLCLGLIGIAVFTLIATTFVVAIAAAVAALAVGWQGLATAMQGAFAQGSSERAVLVALSLVIYFGVAAGVFAVAKWQGKSQWRELIGWRPFRLLDRRIWMIIIAALVYSAVANSAIDHVVSNPPEQLTIPTDPAAAAVLFILAVIFAPVTEELVFRGWLYTGLRFSWGIWPALLVSSAFFAAAHYERTHLYALAVFPIGLALGAVRECTGSVKASIFFHAINNLAAFSLSMLLGG